MTPEDLPLTIYESHSWRISRQRPCEGGTCPDTCMELHGVDLRRYLNDALVSLLDEQERNNANVFVMSYSYWRRHPNTYPHDTVYDERGMVEYTLYANLFTPKIERRGLWWLENLRALNAAYPDLLRLMNLRVQIDGTLYRSGSVDGTLPLTTSRTHLTEVFT